MEQFDIFCTSSYDFDLPSELIAQEPQTEPDLCRLLIVDRNSNSFYETIFKEIINYIDSGDVLVLNNTKVIPAKLIAKRKTGAKVEILLVKKLENNKWEVLLRPAKRAKINETLYFDDDFKFTGKVVDSTDYGGRIFLFDFDNVDEFLKKFGKIPLPHYIKKNIEDLNKYQTIYAKKEGAIAAPTAGFHFTESLLKNLKDKGIRIVEITLHCGISTFRPIKAKDIREHILEPEWVEIEKDVAETINCAKQNFKKIIAVGTTVTRTLESLAFFDNKNIAQVKPYKGLINLYITCDYKFKIVDRLITNFHTPRSTNLVLVAAFCGYKLLMEAYNYAISKKFKFYSFGDAMFII